MTAVIRSITALVSRRLAMSVMVSGVRVISSSGMRANGMPKDSTIWE